MKIYFCDAVGELCAAWAKLLSACSLPAEFEILHCDITSLKVGAVVSPANSFGFMDGGVDLAYSHAFGWGVQERLQELIRKRPHGELLVGEALAVETENPDIPWLISAPTMRTPRRIVDIEAVFLAARAAVVEAGKIGVSSLAFPGMGTGAGAVPPEPAARLMISGVREGLAGRAFPKSLREMFALREELLAGFSLY